MTTIDRFATSSLEGATVHITSPARTLTDAAVEYCVSSGYVRATDRAGTTLITHISNVAIELG